MGQRLPFPNLNSSAFFRTSSNHKIKTFPGTRSSSRSNKKKVLVWLSTLEADTAKDGSAWINLFKEHNLEISVADWLQMQQFEWFTEQENHLFALNIDKVNYYLLALQNEPNIKGTVK